MWCWLLHSSSPNHNPPTFQWVEWQLLSQIAKLFWILSQFFGIMHPRVSGWSLSQFFPFPHSHTSVCSCSKLVALWAEALKDLRAVCSLRHWKSVCCILLLCSLPSVVCKLMSAAGQESKWTVWEDLCCGSGCFRASLGVLLQSTDSLLKKKQNKSQVFRWIFWLLVEKNGKTWCRTSSLLHILCFKTK